MRIKLFVGERNDNPKPFLTFGLVPDSPLVYRTRRILLDITDWVDQYSTCTVVHHHRLFSTSSPSPLPYRFDVLVHRVQENYRSSQRNEGEGGRDGYRKTYKKS